MKKHARDKSQRGWKSNANFLRKRGVAEDDRGNRAVLECEEVGRFLGEIDLVEKHGDTDADEGDRHDGSKFRGVFVVKWNHDGSKLGIEAATHNQTWQSGVGWWGSVAL